MDRISMLRKELEKNNLHAILISTESNRFYMSGFTGSAGMVFITLDNQYFITDFRYVEQANKQTEGFIIIDHLGEVFKSVKSIIDKENIKEIGFEGLDSYTFYDSMKNYINSEEIRFTPFDEQLIEMRMTKSDEEIESIRIAASIADKGFDFLLDFIQVGQSEKEIAVELEYFMKKNGAQGVSFESIVASGERSSLPHGVPSDRILCAGDLIVLDFGCIYNHYCSDMTRTISIGPISEEKKNIYNIVKKAQRESLAMVTAGVVTSSLDYKARSIIDDLGYGAHFGHSLGHGVGIDIHELPTVSAKSSVKLKENMVITIEPGIYLEGNFGVRIEDLVVVKENGYEVLSKSPKELQIIDI